MLTSKLPYEAPEMKTLGTVHEMTLAFNKIGGNADAFSPTTPLIGSLVPH